MIFGVESLKSLKDQEKYITAEKSITENPRRNVRFLSWRTFFVGKFSIQSTNEMAFKHYAIWRHQTWCSYAIFVQQMYACARKMAFCSRYAYWVWTKHSNWRDSLQCFFSLRAESFSFSWLKAFKKSLAWLVYREHQLDPSKRLTRSRERLQKPSKGETSARGEMFFENYFEFFF